MNKPMFKARAALAALLLCSGCNTAPLTVQMHAAATPSASTSRKVIPAFCELRISKLIDKRMDPTVLGSVAGRTIYAPENHLEWLQNELHGLSVRGVPVSFDSAPAETKLPSLNAEVELITAWLNSAATSKATTVVLRFSYRDQTGPLAAATYRGNVTNVNWGNGDGEIQRSLDQAFGQTLDQAATEVHRLCKAG